MPVERFREHNAGYEGAQRGRQVQRMHQRRGGDDREQAGDHERSRSPAANQPEQGIENRSPDENKADHR
jgi:hypothetical protein